MNCRDIERKIYTNEVLLNEEKDHLTICFNCSGVYDFNNYLSLNIRGNLQYPYFKLSFPASIYADNKKSLYFLLKPAMSYAFILIIGLSLGYFVGNIIYYKPSHDSYLENGEGSSKFIRVNPMMPIATNDTGGRRKSFAVPVDEGMKKELNLYGGVVLLGTDMIKRMFSKCNNSNSIDVDLKRNDIVIEVNGNTINDEKALESNIVSNCDSVIFKIMRNGSVIEKKYDFKVKRSGK